MVAQLSQFLNRLSDMAHRAPGLMALALGLISATGFAPLGLWPLALLALALLLLLIEAAGSHRRALLLGWLFGVGHFILGLNWIATAFTYQAAMPAWLGWIAVAGLSLYLALYPALAVWCAWALTRRLMPGLAGSGPGQARLAPLVLAFAGCWIVAEWLRSWVFTGFAWNSLGVMAVDLGGAAQWIGTYGLSGLVILVAGGIACLLRSQEHAGGGAALSAVRRSAWQRGAPIALMVLPVAVTFLASLAGGPGNARGVGPTVTVVQPKIGQADKWQGDKADANFSRLARLTVPRHDRPRLILWPEAAIPDYLEPGYPWVYYDRSPEQARARLTGLMNQNDLMLLGALKLEMDQTGEVVGARNAVMTLGADGKIGPRYDKAHLVPYGEYLPMRPILSAIGLSRLAPGDLDFWPGPGPRTLELGKFGRAGIQICYEIIFSGQVVDRASRPDFIFNPSNDAWFGSWGPPQHLAQARLRAIEEGLPVVRSTPTGISAVIDARGIILRSLPMGTAGRIDMSLPPPHKPTLFARFGNLLPLIFAAFLCVLAIASQRQRR